MKILYDIVKTAGFADLERYKHLYFREVHTYTRAEFDKYIEEKFTGGTIS